MFGDSISIQQALSITVICMTVVFLVLAVLSLILESFKYISLKETKNKEAKNNHIKGEKIESNSKKDSFSQEKVLSNLECEDDIVAVIAASIAASSGNHKSKVRIKSIKRIK